MGELQGAELRAGFVSLEHASLDVSSVKDGLQQPRADCDGRLEQALLSDASRLECVVQCSCSASSCL